MRSLAQSPLPPTFTSQPPSFPPATSIAKYPLTLWLESSVLLVIYKLKPVYYNWRLMNKAKQNPIKPLFVTQNGNSLAR